MADRAKKKPGLNKKLKRLMKTIKSWYEKDENGKVNRVAQVCFGYAVFLPFGIIEAVKLGIYSKYSLEKLPVKILLEGISIPMAVVLTMGRRVKAGAFGTKEGAFDIRFLFMFLFAYVILFAVSYINADLYKNKSTKSKGTSMFGKLSDFNAKMAYCDENGEPIDPPENSYEPGNMILSKNIRYALEPKGTNTYSCALIVGVIGSGKTLTYVKPNILQMNSSYVITDPKGELTSDLGTALMNHGYEVKVFNINEPEYSCKYNPFRYIRCEADVVTAVNVFLDNTKQTDSNGDAFFDLAEKNFYLAIFFYIYTVYKDQPEKQTFKTIYEIYQSSDEQEVALKKGEAAPVSRFDEMFRALAKEDPSNPSLPYYATFKKGSMKTKQSILISVGVKLWFLSVGSIANLMSGDTLELEKIGDRKTALFIIIPSEKDTYKPLSAMLFTQLFETLYYVGNTLNEKSWLLQKDNCVALRSDPFIAGTESEEKAYSDLVKKREFYSQGYIEDDRELMKTDPKARAYFETRNKHGFCPFPRARLVHKDKKTGERKVLMEFQGRAQADMFYDAIRNGAIVRGKKELTNHVRFMMDEFFSIGKIDKFDMKIATFRSLRMSCDIIVQSITQLKEMYEDRESKITNNCSIQICLGAASMEDCQYFSDMSGQKTVQSESHSVTRKGLTPGLDGGNLSDTDEMVLRPEEIREMDKDRCLIFVNTQKPIWDQKYKAFDHKRWRETYSSYDAENTIKNQFQFRRLFYIEQDDSNRVITIIKDPPSPGEGCIDERVKCGTGRITRGEALDGGMKAGKRVFDDAAANEAPIGREGAHEDRFIGMDGKPALESVNESFEKEMKRIRHPEDRFRGAMDKDGNISVSALGDDIVNGLISGLKEGSKWKVDPETKVVTPTKSNTLAAAIKRGSIRQDQVITDGYIGDVVDLWT